MAKNNSRPARNNRNSNCTRNRDAASSGVYTNRRNNRSQDNDVSWYAVEPQLVKDAASLAFSNPLGSPFSIANAQHSSYFSTVEDGVPGIMVLRTLHTPGISADNSSPVNVAARKLYSFVRHANSGHSNYDSPDLMLYVLGMDSLYSAWAFMVRAYGCLNLYSQSNRYYPQGVLEAMGLDFKDFQSNIADFRAYINTVAHKLRSLCVPTSMSYITRHVWMYSNMFLDSSSKKAQLYMYTPAYLYQFDAVGESTGGRLIPVEFNGSVVPELKTFTELKAIVDAMLAKVIEDEDMNIMSGDILKAFGSEKLYTVPMISEDLITMPSYSEEVASQIQNVTPTGRPLAFTAASATSPTDWEFYIHQDVNTNSILFNPYFEGYGYVNPRVFNIRADSPTPEMVMVASRCTNIANKEFKFQKLGSSTFTHVHTYEDLGSDVVMDIHMVVAVRDGKTVRFAKYQFNTAAFGTFNMEQGVDLTLADFTALLRAERFDWHPYQYWFADSGLGNDEPTYTVYGMSGDFDNFTKLLPDELKKMHETALLSQFAVPTMGGF